VTDAAGRAQTPTGPAIIAVLAHADRPALEALLRNIAVFAPEADVVLFNGGHDANLARGLDIEVCPHSRPLEYGHIAPFHYLTMKWLHEERRRFSFVVTAECDMALIRGGFPEYLRSVLARRDSSYLGVGLWERTHGRFPIGMTRQKWERVWQPIFGIECPYGALNPGQVFGPRFVERLMAFPRLDELVERLERTTVWAMEELVYPTLAVTLDCAPWWHPGHPAITLQRHTPLEYKSFLEIPQVQWVHKVGTKPTDVDRRIVDDLTDGVEPDFDAYQARYRRASLVRRAAVRRRARVLTRRVYRRLRTE
jgi:hypothetical protein